MPLSHFLPAPVAKAEDTKTHALLRRRSAWTSTFVASLELAKQGAVAMDQDDFLGPIHLGKLDQAGSA